jgi:REP element-mobilizing transposase RayT
VTDGFALYEDRCVTFGSVGFKPMPRSPRIHVPGGLYHAILRGNHREAIFHRPDDYQDFEAIVVGYLARYEARLHAYCWMPNHVHLAVQVGTAPLGRLMQAVASCYARRKQRSVPTTGHLFERRYRAKLVAADAYLLALVRYIHRNPVRAGLVSDPGGYAWSSHRAYLGHERPWWLSTEMTFALLGSRTSAPIKAYCRFMAEEPDDEEIRAIRCIAEPGKPSRPPPEQRPGITEPRRKEPETLEALVCRVADELNVDVEQLASRRRDPQLVRARAEVARRAIAGGVATLSAVATRFGRAASSLSEQLCRRFKERSLAPPD